MNDLPFLPPELRTALPTLQPLWPLGAVVGGFLLLRVLAAAWRWSRLARSGIAEIDRMEGREFEVCLERLFGRLGYDVERTRATGDFGADLVLRGPGELGVVQAKRASRPVGVKAVQEAVAARAFYACETALVVTNHRFTRQAEELAAANGVELWDRDALVRALLQARRPLPPRTPARGTRPEPPSAPSARCAACDRPVSHAARDYCRQRPDRFGGRVYCPVHQRGRRGR